ncbi:predicted protein [Nematostella vectensis]|uniref:Uncharacterized protein n=1 Tax=Nematostella vectensis TaxID=45351 RepID=A7SN58_NEMVE|nr:predicted protein [Nematostella vectensis]|eukprot:XP_001626959.1 predicted protein [Nematostella vectensis]
MIPDCIAYNDSDPVVIERTSNSSEENTDCSFDDFNLRPAYVHRICDCLDRFKSREEALEFVKRFRLEFCDVIQFHEAVGDLMNSSICTEILWGILRVDQSAFSDYNVFQAIMSRVDCNFAYSVRWTCADCKDAYKTWVCNSKVLPYVSLKTPTSCVSLCHRVLQRCPYFLPGSDFQWSGQSAFECRDGQDGAGQDECFIPETTTAIPKKQTSPSAETKTATNSPVGSPTSSLVSGEADPGS